MLLMLYITAFFFPVGKEKKILNNLLCSEQFKNKRL